MRIAINGMGRIGRLLFRRLIEYPGIELVAVNDIMPVANLAYLLKYDSVYGTFPFSLTAGNESITARSCVMFFWQNIIEKHLRFQTMHLSRV